MHMALLTRACQTIAITTSHGLTVTVKVKHDNVMTAINSRQVHYSVINLTILLFCHITALVKTLQKTITSKNQTVEQNSHESRAVIMLVMLITQFQIQSTQQCHLLHLHQHCCHISAPCRTGDSQRECTSISP